MNMPGPPAAQGGLSLQWLQTVVRFNLRPALVVHPTRLPHWAREVSSLSASVVAALSRDILTRNALVDDYDWNISDPVVRLFMMEPNARDQIAMVLGVAAHRAELRRVVRKSHLDILRAALGQAMDGLWLPVSELVAGTRQPLRIDWSALNADSLQQRMVHDGYQQMLVLLDRSKSASWKRAALCPPQDFVWQAGVLQQTPARQALLNRIVADVLPRWAPQWTWLF